jgi:hypothetical protein
MVLSFGTLRCSSLSFAELVDIWPSLSFDGADAVEAAVEASSEWSEELEL